MKYFMIRYRFTEGPREAWHQAMKAFIAAIEGEPSLKGRVSYRCMKVGKDTNEYCHIAAVADDDAPKDLQKHEFFTRYSEETRRVSGGSVEVVPLEIVAETAFRL